MFHPRVWGEEEKQVSWTVIDYEAIDRAGCRLGKRKDGWGRGIAESVRKERGVQDIQKFMVGNEIGSQVVEKLQLDDREMKTSHVWKVVWREQVFGSYELHEELLQVRNGCEQASE